MTDTAAFQPYEATARPVWPDSVPAVPRVDQATVERAEHYAYALIVYRARVPSRPDRTTRTLWFVDVFRPGVDPDGGTKPAYMLADIDRDHAVKLARFDVETDIAL